LETDARTVNDAGAVSTVPSVGDVMVTGGAAAVSGMVVPSQTARIRGSSNTMGRRFTL
jgi:hypothetical protein